MAASTTTLIKTVTADLSPPTIENTGERRYTETYVQAKYYLLNVTALGDSLTIDTLGASSVTFTTDKLMTVKVPSMDGSGDFPETTTEGAFALNGDGEGAAFSGAAAGEAGWISGGVMPPAIRLTNAASADATVNVYVVYPTR